MKHTCIWASRRTLALHVLYTELHECDLRHSWQLLKQHLQQQHSGLLPEGHRSYKKNHSSNLALYWLIETWYSMSVVKSCCEEKWKLAESCGVVYCSAAYDQLGLNPLHSRISHIFMETSGRFSSQVLEIKGRPEVAPVNRYWPTIVLRI